MNVKMESRNIECWKAMLADTLSCRGGSLYSFKIRRQIQVTNDVCRCIEFYYTSSMLEVLLAFSLSAFSASYNEGHHSPQALVVPEAVP